MIFAMRKFKFRSWRDRDRPWRRLNYNNKLILPILLVVAGVLFGYGAMHNGMANSYYAAAVQAASADWVAWLFGSLDSANFVSVDKPPLATMIMGLSARFFGFSSFSMLLPNILAGVGSIWLIYTLLKRYFGAKQAVWGAIAMIITPSLALMAGFNNPDALLMLFLTASIYATARALDSRHPIMWLILAGAMTGCGFNTKMLQGYLVLPALAIAYLLFTRTKFIKRIGHLLVAGLATTISSLWWVIIVWLTPAANRPWVGSTNDNSIWSLILGYNGFGRFLGGSGGAGGSPGGSGFGGSTGWLRIFNGDFGPNIGIFVVLAIIGGLVAGYIYWRQRDRQKLAITTMSLLSAITQIVVFSMTGGVIHPYYVVALVPAIGALVGIALPIIYGEYHRRTLLGLMWLVIVAISAMASGYIIGTITAWKWLEWMILGAGGFALIIAWIRFYHSTIWLRYVEWGFVWLVWVVPSLSLTLATVSVAHTGSIPTAGPSATGMAGSNNEQSQTDNKLVEYLLDNRGNAKWLVAVNSANESAAIQLTSKQPVMALGGFNGSDPVLTLAQFKQLVKTGQVKYYLSSGMGGGMRSGSSNEIINWIKQNGKKVEYGSSDNVVLYRLSVD